MRRGVKSPQRKAVVLGFRIEGSTGTPSIEGPDREKITVADTAVGTYTCTISSDIAFPDTDAYIVVATVEGADKAATVTKTSASVFVVKVNDIDETPALSDDDVSVIVYGLESSEHR